MVPRPKPRCSEAGSTGPYESNVSARSSRSAGTQYACRFDETVAFPTAASAVAQVA